MSDIQNVEKMRHSLSHIMAAAIKRLYSDTTTIQFGIGPAIDNGFYYDIDFGGQKISEEDFKKIEKEMRKIIAQKLPIVRSEKSRAEALKWAKDNGQKYKEELINDLPEDEVISFYTLGDFEDLCRGPHVENTGEVGVFNILLSRKKLRSVITANLAKNSVCSASRIWLGQVCHSLRHAVRCYAIAWRLLQIATASAVAIRKFAFRILPALTFIRPLVILRNSQRCYAL